MKKMTREDRQKERERQKCICYTDKEKTEQIFKQYERKIEQRKKFRKYGT